MSGYLLFGQVLLLQGSQHLLRQQLSHLSDADVSGQFRLLKDSDRTEGVNVLNVRLKPTLSRLPRDRSHTCDFS